ncbi:Sulfite reductase [NADPH] flavoprotein alpha-component [Novipirellula aureliae]|uniref:Sulfite reductase [NADPH] flavoprotein alpha-component n=1 Tax=Novipirellula aureliae TaxID=2527966 RepID=A0A5C6DI65_9BACT|nr:flavodoxin domain-containing protein [Novipirellula aureliae]TWU35764.1 Sulfite reductase [NADPH] flavoprotein alpha-component [Novipirellula aureliae]
MHGRLDTQLVNVFCLMSLSVVGILFATWSDGVWWIATPRADRWFIAMIILVAFAVLIWWSSRKPASAHPPPTRAQWRVIYATETGFAEEIAKQTVLRLQTSGELAERLPIDEVALDALLQYERVLFIVSTAGQGDPPEHAIAFADTVMAESPDLSGVHYAVLALGDSSYDDYCAFGRQLDQWLQWVGADCMFDRIDVDDGDPAALDRWFASLPSDSMQKICDQQRTKALSR